jgi:large subunit ribosomal protein L17
MNKRSSKIKLGRSKSHRNALLKNQMRSIFKSGSIVTTTAKGKALRKNLDIFLNKIQEDNLDNNKYMHEILGKKELVQIAREYVDKSNPSVTIVRVSFRSGDSAETLKVTLVGYEELFGKREDKKGKAKKTADKKVSKQKEEGESVTSEKREVMEKKGEADKGLMGKLNKNLKGKFVSKERVRSRSGL